MNTLKIADHDLAHWVEAAIHQDSQSLPPVPCLGPTYVAVRHQGRLLFDYWGYELELGEVLRGAFSESFYQEELLKADTIELALTHGYRRVTLDSFNRDFSNIHIGIRGIELQYKAFFSRYSPTRMIATNRDFGKFINLFLEHVSVSAETFGQDGGVMQTFEARQVLVTLKPSLEAVTLLRGDRPVLMQSMSGALLLEMAHLMGEWLHSNTQDNGRITYKYWPSAGKESDANNMIRQFMANLCLVRYARFTQKPDHLAIATRCLDYNLAQFYREEDRDGETIGFIEYEEKVKLGAIALAALAILEHPEGDRYRDSFQKLCRGVESLWEPSGLFRSFLKPADRMDNQNFYPGEALLFWASLYSANRDETLLERCRQSFLYYRDWHRNNRNPAFIPWHTQAYVLLYEMTGDAALRDFVFEMNDWLLGMQQWDGALYPDVQGRFYNPKHPEYGPPHASATGVYLEGLTDAYRLAKAVQDTRRAESYRIAIWRGLRSVRQLQFKDDIMMFYVSKRDRVRGGVRTTVYDNTIRVDNVQHCMMAILKLCQIPEFANVLPTQEIKWG